MPVLFQGFSVLVRNSEARCMALLLIAAHTAAGTEPHRVPGQAPEVSSVEPASAGRGSSLKLKITGKNLAPGARVSFSNPGIRVLDTSRSKENELTTSIRIAPDAPTGTTGLYVVNPDDTEVEAKFSVTEEAAVNQGEAQASSAPEQSAGASDKPVSSGSSSSAKKGKRFEVYSLGKVGAILKSPGNAPKGVLEISGQKLTYAEEDKTVFSVRRSEVREIEPNVLLGVNTGTFHVILSSGKTYNFLAGSFRPADGQSIVNSLQQWLR
jgi:hypothetical protein